MTNLRISFVAVGVCLLMQACAANPPVVQNVPANQPQAQSCDTDNPCDNTDKKNYQYYLGLWTTILFK